MEKHVLSKSTFIRGVQCLKSLYFYKNFIQLRDPLSSEQQAIFSRGNAVGVLAQKLFPNGIDASPGKRSDTIQAVQKTKDLIENGVEVIYEAAFQFAGVLSILDVLVKKNGQWYAYEVKSSAKISQTYILDASLQYWVISSSGILLEDISIININSKYVKNGAIEVDKLFKITSVKEEVLRNQSLVADKIQEAKAVIGSAQMPEIKIGAHCFSPYACDFMGQCWKSVPANSVFEIAGITKEEQFGFYNSGIKTIAQIPEKNELNEHANSQLKALKNDEIKVDKDLIKNFIDSLIYPLNFIDFETFMPAIPIYDKTHPYQNIAFQFSLHIKDEKGKLEHIEFLGEAGIDPRKSFLENVLKATEGKGSILVYDALMERGILNGLKKDLPEYALEIDQRLGRIVDLMKPFQDKAYYHPKFKGSFSLKNVLPAIAPELSYAGLKISSGSIAMIAFEKLQTESDMFKIIETREALLEYCKMDTLAMVKIFEVLENAISE